MATSHVQGIPALSLSVFIHPLAGDNVTVSPRCAMDRQTKCGGVSQDSHPKQKAKAEILRVMSTPGTQGNPWVLIHHLLAPPGCRLNKESLDYNV